jgi:hypothetical protein
MTRIYSDPEGALKALLDNPADLEAARALVWGEVVIWAVTETAWEAEVRDSVGVRA